MTRVKKTAALHRKNDNRRAPRRRAAFEEQGRIDQILAEAKIGNGSRGFFVRAAVRYADLMKRLADK